MAQRSKLDCLNAIISCSEQWCLSHLNSQERRRLFGLGDDGISFCGENFSVFSLAMDELYK